MSHHWLPFISRNFGVKFCYPVASVTGRALQPFRDQEDSDADLAVQTVNLVGVSP